MDSAADSKADPRFTAQGATAEELLKSQTVGLVNLSEFRKRRAEAHDQKERQASDSDGLALSDGPAGSNLPKKKKKKASAVKSKLSFADEDDDDDASAGQNSAGSTQGKQNQAEGRIVKARLGPNSSIGMAPKAMTKSAKLKEADERERLRKEFLTLQEEVKTTEFVIPFVFFDGSNSEGGRCKLKKGDRVWIFLDKSRKVARNKSQAAGTDRNNTGKKEWGRMSVDDLMMVRGDIIIPHHYEFYYFIANKILGHSSRVLFPYSTQAPAGNARGESPPASGLSMPGTKPLGGDKSAAGEVTAEDMSLEGVDEDPTFTKVVDRRWFERNKHIWPASVWEEFDPTKDYAQARRTDAQGNSFFF